LKIIEKKYLKNLKNLLAHRRKLHFCAKQCKESEKKELE